MSEADEVFDDAARVRLGAVEHLGLRGEDRLAGLVTGAGYPDALDPIVDAIIGVRAVVVDVGAGLGAASSYLASRSGCRVVALEPEAAAAALGARTFPGLAVAVGDAAALPIAAGGCGAVTLLGALSLVPDLDAVLREAARAIRVGGRLAITDLCLARDQAPQLAIGANVFRSDGALVSGLGRHGFDVDANVTMPASRGTRWDAVIDRVDTTMEDRFGTHPAMSAWREDRAVLHRLITDGTLEVATIVATARQR
jgi:SAM-dependent methyltransferase